MLPLPINSNWSNCPPLPETAFCLASLDNLPLGSEPTILSSALHFTFAPSYDLLAPDIWNRSLVPSQLIQNVSAKHLLCLPTLSPPWNASLLPGKRKIGEILLQAFDWKTC